MKTNDALCLILKQLERIADSLDQHGVVPPTDWSAANSFRLQHRAHAKPRLIPVLTTTQTELNHLKNISVQMNKVVQNTEQFLKGSPANHVLLTGARGTGKSSLVRALLNRYHQQGLRLIELSKPCLIYLQDVVELLQGRSEKYILFCDDLSFNDNESEYKCLKSVLEGSVSGFSSHVLVYATSNRRHLLPQFMSENLSHQIRDSGEIDPSEASEEKISLSDRFGIWVSFHPFSQQDYLAVVQSWFDYYGLTLSEQAKKMSLRWVIERGHRSGRLALQFTKFWMSQTSI